MIGERIGQYRVLRVLGEGGMGRVLLAEHALMGTLHALKVLHDALSSDEAVVQRFVNEARAAGAIGHRNVVEITHIDRTDAGAWYLVMKYLEGQTLSALLQRGVGDGRGSPSAGSAAEWQRGVVDAWTIVHILGEALNGLHAAHARQIVHRDLKPDNVYLTSTREDPYRTILLDFGVAQLGRDAGVVTRTGALIGTPRYMAPEQHRGEAIDFRTDLWAIGAIAYEMATGMLPYEATPGERARLTGAEMFHRMMTRPIADPRARNPSLTEGFVRALGAALAIDPAARPSSARALAIALADATPASHGRPSGRALLQRYADELLVEDIASTGTQPAHTAISGRPAPVSPPSTLGASASQSVARPRRRASWRWLAAIAAVAAGTLGGIAVSKREQSATAASEGTSAPPLMPTSIKQAPPTQAPPTQAPPTQAPPTQASPTQAPPTQAPPTQAPPTQAPPTQAPPTQAPPTQAPPTQAPPTQAPPTQEPQPEPAKPEPPPPQQPTPEPAPPTPTPTPPTSEPRKPAADFGRLRIVVLPWAEVWIDGKSAGQTPTTAKLAAGPHRVRLKNDSRDKTVTVTIVAGKTTAIDETW